MQIQGKWKITTFDCPIYYRKKENYLFATKKNVVIGKSRK